MSALDRKRGDQSLVQRATADAAAGNGPGKRTLTEQLGPGGPGTALEHIAAAHQVAERDALNAVITVVARGPDGAVVARWRARGRWVGLLPARYHGTRAPWAWSWSDPAARDTRIHTRADGTGGEPIERWATAHGAATVDVIAFDIGGTTEAPDAQAGTSASDHVGGAGAPGGDPHGRHGPDTAIGGTGPGGPHARAGGDREGSKTRGAVEGSRFGSALGVNGGTAGGRFGGEGKPGDDGVTMGGAIAGGVIAVPEAIKGFVDILLIADQGDITGEGANLFKRFGREMAGVSAAAVREWLAGEARQFCEREVQAAANKLASDPTWLALSDDQQTRAMEIAWYEQIRRFFRGFGKAAKGAEPELGDAARIAMEAAEVEPLSARLLPSHQYAGKEFPRELLQPQFREKGLRFKSTGYPDFEPYALTLPNGKKTVRIELTGSRPRDYEVANRAVGFQETPEGYTWHHVEDEGVMMLVPTELHRTVPHAGGAAKFTDRTGLKYD